MLAPEPGMVANRLPAERALALSWWSHAQLGRVATSLSRVWYEWRRDWVPGPHCSIEKTECALAHENPMVANVRWTPLGMRAHALAWIDVGPHHEKDLVHALFGPDREPEAVSTTPPELAQAVASRAWASFIDAARASLELDSAVAQVGPDDSLFKPWSGSVQVQLRGLGRRPCSLLLNVHCARALALMPAEDPAVAGVLRQKPRGALVPVAQALAGRRLPIRVELEACELDLGALEGLRIGDVVPLPHLLDSPLMVLTTTNASVCAGFLGRQAGFKAIELMRVPAMSDRDPRLQLS